MIAGRVSESFEFPALINFSASELLLPTATLPKLIDERLTLSATVVAIAFPDAETVRRVVAPEALKSIDAEPLVAPILVGLKATLNVELFPASILEPLARPDRLKPAPETASDETEIAAFPWFVTVKVCEFVLPTGTFPKLPLEGTTEIVFAFAIPFPESVISTAVENPAGYHDLSCLCAGTSRGKGHGQHGAASSCQGQRWREAAGRKVSAAYRDSGYRRAERCGRESYLLLRPAPLTLTVPKFTELVLTVSEDAVVAQPGKTRTTDRTMAMRSAKPILFDICDLLVAGRRSSQCKNVQRGPSFSWRKAVYEWQGTASTGLETRERTGREAVLDVPFIPVLIV